MHVDMLKHQQAVLGPFTAGMGIPQMLGFSKGNLLKTGLISGFGIIVIWSESIQTSIFACQQTVKSGWVCLRWRACVFWFLLVVVKAIAAK